MCTNIAIHVSILHAHACTRASYTCLYTGLYKLTCLYTHVCTPICSMPGQDDVSSYGRCSYGPGSHGVPGQDDVSMADTVMAYVAMARLVRVV